MKIFLSISSIFISLVILAQGNANRELAQYLKTSKIDTFVILRAGCTNCMISFEQTGKRNKSDTVNIWLLYRKNGIQKLMTFSDTSKTETALVKESNVFQIIEQNREVFIIKNEYYKNQKQLKFKEPCLTTYPYETIEIRYGLFRYKHTLVERETDDCGTILTSEDWFKSEVELLKEFDKLKI